MDPWMDLTFGIISEIDNDNVEIVSITDRGKDSREYHEYYIRTNAPLIKHIFYTNRWRDDIPEDQKSTKAEICVRERVDIMIEDSPKHALECAESDVLVYLFDKPWNRDLKGHPGIIRVSGWRDVFDRFSGLMD
jgi:hypothetical protein